MIIREPKFAGRFYPDKTRSLVAMLQDLYNRVESSYKKLRAKGVLLPHAAYHYSGQITMSVLKCIEIPENIIILAPNHSGIGPVISIIAEGRFITPIGDVTINSDIAKAMLQEIKGVKEDLGPHLIEHSIEVQLPILKYMKNDIKIVPLLIKKMNPDTLSDTISNMISFFKNRFNDALIVSTSDLSHYENYEETTRKDKLLLRYIERMDIDGLREVIKREKISMCGYECTAINISICRSLGADHTIIKRYDTSSTIDGNYESVVGYAGVCFI